MLHGINMVQIETFNIHRYISRLEHANTSTKAITIHNKAATHT
jgi:hypothetical protein